MAFGERTSGMRTIRPKAVVAVPRLEVPEAPEDRDVVFADQGVRATRERESSATEFRGTLIWRMRSSMKSGPAAKAISCVSGNAPVKILCD